jgi:hypothetical protein
VGNLADGRTVKSLPGKELERGAFDLAPVISNSVV